MNLNISIPKKHSVLVKAATQFKTVVAIIITNKKFRVANLTTQKCSEEIEDIEDAVNVFKGKVSTHWSDELTKEEAAKDHKISLTCTLA